MRANRGMRDGHKVVLPCEEDAASGFRGREKVEAAEGLPTSFGDNGRRDGRKLRFLQAYN